MTTNFFFLLLLFFFNVFLTIYFAFVSSSQQSSLYYNNDNRRINIPSTLPLSLPPPLQIDFQHLQTCKRGTINCTHFSKNTDIIDANTKNLITVLKKNSPNEGYLITVQRSNIKCSKKFKARKTLYYVNNSLEYRCRCMAPDIFDKLHIYDDCNVLKKCMGRELTTPSWTTFNDIQCNCKTNEYFIDYEHGGPECRQYSFFNLDDKDNDDDDDTDNTILSSKYINSDYLKQHFSSTKPRLLKNPCVYDALTGLYLNDDENVGITLTKNGIAQCWSKSRKYATIKFTDDYLLNNNGQYPNGVVRVVTTTNKSATAATVVVEAHTWNATLERFFSPLYGYIYQKTDLIYDIEKCFNKETHIIIYSYPTLSEKKIKNLNTFTFRSYNHTCIMGENVNFITTYAQIYRKITSKRENFVLTNNIGMYEYFLDNNDKCIPYVDPANILKKQKITQTQLKTIIPTFKYFIHPFERKKDNTIVYNTLSPLYTGTYIIDTDNLILRPLASLNDTLMEQYRTFVRSKRNTDTDEREILNNIIITDGILWPKDYDLPLRTNMEMTTITGQRSCVEYNVLVKDYDEMNQKILCTETSLRIQNGAVLEIVPPT
nr:hypothetical protein [Microctonus hyperodae filamentous virus]